MEKDLLEKLLMQSRISSAEIANELKNLTYHVGDSVNEVRKIFKLTLPEDMSAEEVQSRIKGIKEIIASKVSELEVSPLSEVINRLVNRRIDDEPVVQSDLSQQTGRYFVAVPTLESKTYQTLQQAQQAAEEAARDNPGTKLIVAQVAGSVVSSNDVTW